MQSRTREAYIGHITHTFVRFTRREEIRSRTELHLPRLVQIKQCRSKGIDITIAGTKHTVVEQQPAFTGFDRNRAGTYFQALPCTLFKRRRRHDMPMASPKLQVGRLAIINISERSMPVVTGTAQHGKITINLAREQHAITVERQESILHLVERLEIRSPCHADGGLALISVTPSHIVTVIDKADTRVITIHPFTYLGDITLELQLLRIDVPMNGILAESHMKRHPAVCIITTEHSGIPFAERYYRTIEYTIGCRQQITGNDRIRTTSPHYIFTTFGTLLPRHTGQRIARNLQFTHILFFVRLIVFLYFLSSCVKGTNQVIRKAGMVATSTKMKNSL